MDITKITTFHDDGANLSVTEQGQDFVLVKTSGGDEVALDLDAIDALGDILVSAKMEIAARNREDR